MVRHALLSGFRRLADGLLCVASTVFSSMGVFDVLRNQLFMVFWQLPMTIQGLHSNCGSFDTQN